MKTIGSSKNLPRTTRIPKKKHRSPLNESIQKTPEGPFNQNTHPRKSRKIPRKPLKTLQNHPKSTQKKGKKKKTEKTLNYTTGNRKKLKKKKKNYHQTHSLFKKKPPPPLPTAPRPSVGFPPSRRRPRRRTCPSRTPSRTLATAFWLLFWGFSRGVAVFLLVFCDLFAAFLGFSRGLLGVFSMARRCCFVVLCWFSRVFLCFFAG